LPRPFVFPVQNSGASPIIFRRTIQGVWRPSVDASKQTPPIWLRIIIPEAARSTSSSRKGEALSGIVTGRSAYFFRSRLALCLAGMTAAAIRWASASAYCNLQRPPDMGELERRTAGPPLREADFGSSICTLQVSLEIDRIVIERGVNLAAGRKRSSRTCQNHGDGKRQGNTQSHRAHLSKNRMHH